MKDLKNHISPFRDFILAMGKYVITPHTVCEIMCKISGPQRDELTQNI